jgi:Beta propeller domain
VGEVYATPESLYVAVYEPGSGPWRVNSASAAGTRIHKFDLTESVARPVYEASGRVDGHVLNSFAMDDADDHFRIATTSFEGRNWTPVSGLYMLRQVGGELMQVGEVTGIEPGEEIYAVRFVDDAAYVVTFFQMDPLFTFDLSDPENPQQMGELEITGFSTYLHPLGGNHLIGVGEEVDPDSGMFEGVQISLFDVSDLSDPLMTDRVVINTGWSSSEALYDHHAFNYYGPLDMLSIPVSYEGAEYGSVSFAGLHTYEITPGNDILLMGEIDASALIDPDVEDPYYGQYCSQVRRSVVIEDVVYAISAGGIIAAGVEDLSTQYAVLAFPDHGNCDQTWEWWMM